MKKISALLTFLILVGIFVPAVSANENITITTEDLPFEHTFSAYSPNVFTNAAEYSDITTSTRPERFGAHLRNVEYYRELSYFYADTYENTALPDEMLPVGENWGVYNRPSDGTEQPIVVYVAHKYDILGAYSHSQIIAFPQNWEIGDATGFWCSQITINGKTYNMLTSSVKVFQHSSHTDLLAGGLGCVNPYTVSPTNTYVRFYYFYYPEPTYGVVGGTPISTGLSISDTSDYGYSVYSALRQFEGENYPSKVEVFDATDTSVWQSNKDINETIGAYKFTDLSKIVISNAAIEGFAYEVVLSSDPIITPTPTPTHSVIVYVRNSQTGALIANAYINISASVNGNLHEVVNETAPSGIYSIDLQPTGGGMPNPDFYRLITTVEGYNSIMPYIDFEVDGATTIYAYLDPTGGAPEDENKTFIDFYVRDLAANGISGATVNFGGYTLITNSAGYTMFEVDKSKTYSWSVSKSGYGSLTGNAVIGSNARHTINTVLAPAVTPTTPTAIPTSTPISPTPTMTAPTGEPTSNLLEWFAAHFGMILGGGVEIGKIFMWLCFAVPVGVYVGKEAKAGAAGFMVGAGIVTLFFVLIGWVPIWLLVLMALIIGLLYAKVFNNSDTGGGR